MASLSTVSTPAADQPLGAVVHAHALQTPAAGLFQTNQITSPLQQVLRSPLEELKARQERRRKKEAAAAAAAAAAVSVGGRSSNGAAPAAFPGASSSSFGASLFAMTSGRDAGAAAADRGGGGSRAVAATADIGGGERPHEDVMAVVEQVRSRGGGACGRICVCHPCLQSPAGHV